MNCCKVVKRIMNDTEEQVLWECACSYNLESQNMRTTKHVKFQGKKRKNSVVWIIHLCCLFQERYNKSFPIWAENFETSPNIRQIHKSMPYLFNNIYSVWSFWTCFVNLLRTLTVLPIIKEPASEDSSFCHFFLVLFSTAKRCS